MKENLEKTQMNKPLSEDELNKIKKAMKKHEPVYRGGILPCKCNGTGWISVLGPGGRHPCPHCSPKYIK